MPSWKRSLLAAVTLIALVGVTLAADQRTWTDKTGKYKVEGKLVRVTNVSVTLQLPNGRLTSIAISKLSDADRDYVKKELADSKKPKDPKEPGGKPESEDPFKPGESTPPGGPSKPAESGKPGELPGQEGPAADGPKSVGRPGRGRPGEFGEREGGLEPSQPGTPGGRMPPSAGEGGVGSSGGQPPPGPSGDTKPLEKPAPTAVPTTEVAPDWSVDLTQAKSVGLSNIRDAFPLSVGSALKMPKPASPDPVAIPKAPDFFDTISGLAMSVRSGKAVVGRINQRPGSPDAFSRFYICDLTGEQRAEPTRITGNYAPLALSDDGNTLLVRQVSDAFGNGEQLEFWSITGKYKRLAMFKPYEGASKHDAAVKHALFAGPNQLVTSNAGGSVVAWEVSSGKPLYQLSGQRDAAPTLSADGKFLAVATDQEVAILDVAAGKAVALLPVKSLGHAAVAFSPDGKRLAHGNMGVMTIFDLTTGQQEKSFDAPFVNLNDAAFCWADTDHVLAGDTVYSVEYGVALWKYSGGERFRPAGEYIYTMLNNRDRAPGALVPVLMPPARAVKQLEAISRTPDFVILKPGSEIKIDTSGVSDPLKQSQIRIALIKRAEAAGYQVADDAKVVLKATTGFGKEEEVTYTTSRERMGLFRGSEKPKSYKVRPFYANVVIEYEGKTAWRQGSGGTPFGLLLRNGETVESRMAKLSEPNYALFDAVKLPKKLNKPLGDRTGAGLGSSTITAAGAR